MSAMYLRVGKYEPDRDEWEDDFKRRRKHS
jgi:hypothetical protein